MTPTLKDHHRALAMMMRMADCDLPVQRPGNIAHWDYEILSRISHAYATAGGLTSVKRDEFETTLAHAEQDCQLVERHGATKDSR